MSNRCANFQFKRSKVEGQVRIAQCSGCEYIRLGGPDGRLSCWHWADNFACCH